MPARPSKLVLILEDEPLLAMELASVVEDLGLDILGPAGSCQSALDLLQTQKPDGAVLDILIGDEKCDVVADALDRLSVPWSVSTGFTADTLEPRYRNARVMQKPCPSARVQQVLLDMLAPAGEG